MPDPAHVEVVPIESLTPDAANVRRRDDRAKKSLAASLKQFGPARSIVLDGKGIVRAGNGTLEAAQQAGVSEVLIVKPKPGQLVAVKRDDWSAVEATAYGVADNRLGDLATYDDQALGGVLESLGAEGFDLDAIGFTNDEVDELIKSIGDDSSGCAGGNAAEDPGAQIDRAAELQAKYGTARGQLWEIGRHRLLCGDSTDPADVARVMAGDKALLMNTDPPYGVDYAAVKNGIPRSGFQNIQERRGDIENDDLTDGAALQAFLESMIRAALPHLVEKPAFYFWHPMLTQGTFFAAAAAADILIHRQIIWVKPGFVLTRSGMYHWKHELCFYGWIRGKPCPWLGDKSQTSVWEVGRDADAGLHHTQKPVELFVRPIENHTKPGDVVYEPFAGSGSQFVAAEQTGRLARGIEISPAYCAVILERLAGMGLEPRLVS